MKSTRDQFDKELSERLRRYAEEPKNDFWPQIALRIISVTPRSKVWTRRLSIVVIVIASIFFVSVEHLRPRYEMVADISLTRLDPASIEREVSAYQAGQVEILCDKRSLEDSTNLTQKNSTYEVTDLVVIVEKLNPPMLDVSSKTFSVSESVEYPMSSRFFDSAIIQRIVIDPSSEKAVTRTKQRNIFRKSSGLPFYLALMPTFGYQRIESNDNDNVLIQSIRRVPTLSAERLGVRLEVGVQGYLSSRWRGFGGVIYYQRKQTIDFVEKYVDTLLHGSEPGGKPTLEPQFSYRARSFEHELKNLGLHFGVSYLLWKKKYRVPKYRDAFSWSNIPGKPRSRFLHEVGVGIELHKSLNDVSELSSAEGFTNPPLYAFLNAYYRLQYPDKGRIRAILQPMLNYSFYMHKDISTPFYVKPYGLGLNFGCMYQF